MTVSKRTRFEVLRRDNYTCRYCRSTDGVLTIDHVVPVALGGSDDSSNLVAACKDCNAGKSSTAADASTVADVTADALRWAAAIRRAADEYQEDRAALLAALAPIEHDYGRYLPPDWTASVANWLRRGLPAEEAHECVAVAVTNTNVRMDSIFAYACGVARKKLEPIEARARAIFDEGNA